MMERSAEGQNRTGDTMIFSHPNTSAVALYWGSRQKTAPLCCAVWRARIPGWDIYSEFSLGEELPTGRHQPMARLAANGAIISENEQWYWAATGWKPLIANPTSKAPSAILGSERVEVARLHKGHGINDVRRAGETLAALVAKHGSVETAEASIVAVAPSESNAPSPPQPARAPSTPTTPAPAAAPKRAPQVKVQTYKSDKEFQKHAEKMLRDGWRIEGQTGHQGKVAIGRTVGKAVLTGGIGLALMGRSRKNDTITVTWLKD